LKVEESINILHNSAAEVARILGHYWSPENGIKQKAARNTADNKSSKNRSRLSGNILKMIGERESLGHSRFASVRNNVEFT